MHFSVFVTRDPLDFFLELEKEPRYLLLPFKVVHNCVKTRSPKSPPELFLHPIPWCFCGSSDKSQVKRLQLGHCLFNSPQRLLQACFSAGVQVSKKGSNMCIVEACYNKLWQLFSGQNWKIGVHSAVLSQIERDCRQASLCGERWGNKPTRPQPFCSPRKRTFFDKSTAERTIYRKSLKRLGKLNSVTHRLSLKQRDEGKKKSELLVTSCVKHTPLSQGSDELCLLSPAKIFRLVSALFLDCSEYAVSCIGR